MNFGQFINNKLYLYSCLKLVNMIDKAVKDEGEGTRINYSISIVEREDIINNAPDWVQQAPENCIEAYVEQEYARIQLDEHPDRFFTFKNQKYKRKETVDLKDPQLRNKMKARYCTDEDLEKALAIQDSLVMMMDDFELKKKICAKTFQRRVNSKEGKDGKIIGTYTDKLLDLFGKLNPLEEVIKIMEAETGTKLGITELTRFYNANKAIIEKRKEEYVKSSGNYRITSEAGRLDVLNTLLTDSLIQYRRALAEDKQATAQIYSREIKTILEQARKEVKGNELKLTVDGKIDITATVHGSENVGRLMQNIPINCIVVGIVAAKAGLNPLVLINQLATSYYKDFNGFNRNILGRDKIQLPGDLVRTYDWGVLEEKNARFLGEMETVKVEDISHEEIKEDERKRAEILERIRKLKAKK